MEKGPCLGIKFSPRSTNAVADALAKKGLVKDSCSIRMEDVPPNIKKLVHADCL